MFSKKKTIHTNARIRRPAPTINESFRRNNVVVSRRQKEIAGRQQSVTQRQVERKQQLARRRLRTRIISTAVIFLIAAALYLAGIKSVHLETNASSRLNSSQSNEYVKSIQDSFKSNSLLSQPLFADYAAVEREILEQFPEVERVLLQAQPFSASLKAEVRFRKAVFTWRDASGSVQFVDSNGVLFSKNLDPSVNSSKLIAIEDQSGIVLQAGSSVLTDSLIQFVGQLYNKLPPLYENNMAGKVIVPQSTREVQVQMNGAPYVIKFNSTREINGQVGELATLLNFLKANGITPKEYIDLRVAHKAFYK